MKMCIFLLRRQIFMVCFVLFLVYFAHGQNGYQNIDSSINGDEEDGIEVKATSTFGSRIRPKFMNGEFNRDVFQRSQSMDKKQNGRNSVYGNNMEYYSKMSTLGHNQDTSFKTTPFRNSNRKKVKRIRKIKTALHNIRKNISKTWNSIDGPMRNTRFSSANIFRPNLQSREHSGTDKLNFVPPIRKELRNYQDVPINRYRVSTSSYKTVGAKSGAIDLNKKLSNSLLPSLNINGQVSVSNKHSKNETPFPCTCFWSKKECGCSCNDSLIYDNFQELSKSFRPCSNFSFTITGGQHFSLPPNLFTGIGQVQNIHLKIMNATFDYLFDATPYTSAFSGVSFEEAAVIELLGVRVRRGWNWTPLEHLTSSSGAGVEIKLEGCGLRRLSSDFGKVADGKVKTASISDSRLEMIGSGAFSTFNDMTHFLLPRNRLRSIKRTDLPMEPLHLVEIDLRYNDLQSLEGDLFTEMPSLQTISLAGNPLRVLSEATFSSIIGKTSVPGLSDFPLYCDCRLRWLKNSSFTHNDITMSNLKGVVCKRPAHLRGTPFKDLSQEHLMC